MAKQTRREFLKQAAALTGAVALTQNASLAAGQETAVTGENGGPADMAIARWDLAASPEAPVSTIATRLTEQALDAIGGMGRFVSKGNVVWIKANMAWNRPPELAANTNPEVVATLTRLCLEAGAKKVKVGDHTCHDAKLSYKTTGIAAAAEAAGAEVVYLDMNRFRDHELGGKRLQKWPLYPEIVESDLVINVPIVKHHSLSRVSLCMKNYMGVIGGQISSWHQALPACLCDITAFMRPRLCVLDAVRILTAHGPQGGNPADVKQLNTVAAGTDIVALDALGAELLGHRPEDIATVKAGFDAGLGQIDYRQLALRELAVS